MKKLTGQPDKKIFMQALKNIVPEFWDHRERVAGKKGQQYIFRSKWYLLIKVTFVLTIVPLVLSTIYFYRTNRAEAITDLLAETRVLTAGVAADMHIFFDQYLSTLQIIKSQYSPAELKNRYILKKIFDSVRKTSTQFSGLAIIEKNSSVVCAYGNNPRSDYGRIILPETCNKEEKRHTGYITGSDGKPMIFVRLVLEHSDHNCLFIAGFIEPEAIAEFLHHFRVKEILDIYLLDHNNTLLTESSFLGGPGAKPVINMVNEDLPLAFITTSPKTSDHKDNFLFSGISKIDNTQIKLGILMSNQSFKIFMSRIRSHIITMTFFSLLFVFIAVLWLVTNVVQVLYRADKVRQVYLTKAARNSKMASIGQLAAGVAHEINNPLAIINEKAGFLMDLFSFQEEYKADTRLTDAVDSIIRAVKRAGTITHRLLGFARKTDSCAEPINLEETVQEVIGFVRKEAEYKSININIHIPPSIPQIITDRGKLQQILINLVTNAIAALDEHGTLTIRARNNKDNESIELYVEDNGCGIPLENQKKVFEPFFTTKAKIGGTGLGLALTYGLIRDLHGTLELESQPDVGTTFTITLPYEINTKESYEYSAGR